MDQPDILKNLKNPKFYGYDVKSIDILQTHISFVALTGKYAYKVKKPVNFGFLDFSTLEKRKYFCEKELKLNRRLCPDIYLEVLPITRKDNTLELNGNGEIVDYALKMGEFAQEELMANLIKQEKIREETIEKICDILVDFYNSEMHSMEIDNYGKLEAIKQNISENFKQTQSVIDVTISKEVYAFINNASNKFFEDRKSVFDERIKGKHIHDCHGDLHSGNIVVSGDNIYIFDCIEFNKRFRYCDVASDIGFLAMDLDYLNHPYLSSYLIDKYVEKSHDKGIFDVLNFYKSYRAYVRGKVLGFRLSDQNVPEEERENTIETAKKYFDLSQYYASLFSLDLKNKKPLLFIVSGLSGTGKSTISLKISVDYNAHYINTDIIRKELDGIDKFEKHHDEINTGLYSPEKIDYTYEKVMEKAQNLLKRGENIVLDATFQKKSYRDMARKIAEENSAISVLIQCTCPEHIVKKWLEERQRKKTVSDGRWEIYLNQKETFESFTSKEKHIKIDISEGSYGARMESFRKILATIYEGK